MNDTTVTVVGMVCSEIRYDQGPNDETPTARFQIRTVHRRWDKRTGSWTDGDPSYYSAACRRALADHVASSMGVGDPVVATGRLRISRWRRGEENMTSAEIDVQAIGHDLRWGTTVYRRTTPPTRIPGPGRAGSATPAPAPVAVASAGAGAAAVAVAGVEGTAEREALVPVADSAATAAESLPSRERQKPGVGTRTETGTEVVELPVAA